MTFPIEDIDDKAKLFYRINKNFIDHGISDSNEKIKPWAFDPYPRGVLEMSVNWEKYCSALETKMKAKMGPDKYWVVSFVSWNIRKSNLWLKVTHAPSKDNRSHSIIHDVQSEANDPEVRLFLRRICVWEISI